LHEILVVEDEPSIAEVVALYLQRAGFEVRTAGNGQSALDEFTRRPPDLMILDLMLPGMDGFELTGWVRAQGDVPIIMLTSRTTEADRIAGLEMGADDYVVKPFSPQELVSRVRAVLRRSAVPDSRDETLPLQFDGLAIDPAARTVVANGQERALTAKEFDLLYTLASSPRHVFTRDQLLESVWGSADYIDPSTVTVHVRRVREKIEAEPSSPRWVATVWGVGYRFEP
jgi:DNA-binding response OmpR family regulator